MQVCLSAAPASASAGRPGQDLLDQPAGLRQHLFVAARRRAQDEFGDPGLDVGGDALDDRLGVADREIALRGRGRCACDRPRTARSRAGIVGPAEAERDAGAVMVVVDRAALGGGGGADRGDDRAGLAPAFRRRPASRCRTARCAGSPPRTSRRSTSADRAAPALARSRRRTGGNGRPRNRPLSSRHSRRMISSPSSVLRPRVLVSRFRVRHSGASGLPMPKAGNSRPSDRKSIVAHCLATSTGSRNASESTLTPNLSRRVRPASAAMHRHAFEDRLRG